MDDCKLLVEVLRAINRKWQMTPQDLALYTFQMGRHSGSSAPLSSSSSSSAASPSPRHTFIDSDPAALPLTPMLKEYVSQKAAIPKGSLLTMRVGDFYESYFDDAKIMSSSRYGTNWEGTKRRRQNPYDGVSILLPPQTRRYINQCRLCTCSGGSSWRCSGG